MRMDRLRWTGKYPESGSKFESRQIYMSSQGFRIRKTKRREKFLSSTEMMIYLFVRDAGLQQVGNSCFGLPDTWRSVWRPGNIPTLRLADHSAG